MWKIQKGSGKEEEGGKSHCQDEFISEAVGTSDG
jgi:hypothetical protein